MSRRPAAGARQFDGYSIWKRAQQLAFPRYPGTEGDRRAIDRVAGWFEAAGLEVRVESFSYDIRPAFRALRTLLLGSSALVIASAALALSRPALALLLLALALGAGGLFLGWAPWLERIYSRDGVTRTANVTGWHRPKGGERALPTVVLMAHHDSKSQSLTLPYRALATTGSLGGAGALFGLEIAVMAGGAVPVAAVATSAGVAALSLIVLATLRSGNRSPGGVDNAGSVALLAELAEPLCRMAGDAAQLVFLSPGAEEDHMVGAMRWLDRHGDSFERGSTRILNLDGAGIPGRVALLERYGLGRRFSPALSRLAREAAAEIGIKVRGTMLPPAMGVDAIPFANRGFESISLASGSLCRAVLAVHSRHDVGANLDPGSLEEVARLVWAMVAKLVASPTAAAATPDRAPRPPRPDRE